MKKIKLPTYYVDASFIGKGPEPLSDRFIDMCVEEAFNPDWLLEQLNSTPGEWGRFWHEKRSALWPRVLLEIDERTSEITRLQRNYVDLWLATGRTAGGVETPKDRRATWEIHKIVAGFVISRKAEAFPLKDGYRISVMTSQIICVARDPETILRCAPEEAAKAMFVALLISDYRLKIAKCHNDDCGIYFFLGQWNRTYKSGTFCEVCKRRRSIASAKKDTARDRSAAGRRLFSLAAEKFAKQISGNAVWYRDAGLKVSLAEYLNNQIVKSEELAAIYPRGITGKWVARTANWGAIQETVLANQQERGETHVTRKAR